MEACFKILQLKFDQKQTNRCIGLTLRKRSEYGITGLKRTS